MVRRQIPLTRRLRANAGVIANTGIWLGATTMCLVLYAAQGSDAPMHAVAMVEKHPVAVPESGRLASLEVVAGQRVEAGQSLGTIEVPGLAQELVAVQAQLLALQATTEGADPERERRFAKDLSGAQSRWLEGKVTLEAQRAELLGRDMALARLKTPGAAVPASEVEQSQAARDALAREVSAREESVAASERAYVQARALSGGTTDAALEARVQEATARVEMVRARLEASVLRAPTAGTVQPVVSGSDSASPTAAGTLPAAGSWLQAGVPAFAVVEGTTREAVWYVSPDRARELVEGAPVTLESARGERVDAKVLAVSPAVEQVPVRQLADPAMLQWGVAVTVQTAKTELMPGEGFAVRY
ncbi:hypothetical protein LBMAG42_37670 [Deltaproteobacteria bacterium]|nr:hypothetical protein LBMAG42_37670 [Deltaproteobacteria bacterium]